MLVTYLRVFLVAVSYVIGTSGLHNWFLILFIHSVIVAYLSRRNTTTVLAFVSTVSGVIVYVIREAIRM